MNPDQARRMYNVTSFPFSVKELDARAEVSPQHARHACATPVRDETSAFSYLGLQVYEALSAVLAMISFKRPNRIDRSSQFFINPAFS